MSDTTSPATTATTRVLHARDSVESIRRFSLTVRDGDPPAERVVESTGTTLRAGSRPESDLVLSDATVSRIHFEIALEPRGFRLRDLGSTNGTWVDGMRAMDVYIADGARILAGSTQIVFHEIAGEVALPLYSSDRFGGLLGRSASMRELFAKLERVAKADYTVLIEGESGTGKELAAEAIHAASARANAPFVVFDCAAIPANSIERELFGVEEGEGGARGAIDEAEGGTLLIDEIGELPLDLQGKLLRFLEKREFRRIGGRAPAVADVRTIAVTHRDLAREVNLGSFREDLYYRLAIVRLTMPPLASHPEDVHPLAEQFVRAALPYDPDRAARVLASITPENWRRLESYPWRGNVRELRNVIHRALALSGVEAPGAIAPTPPTLASSDSLPAMTGQGLPIDWSRGFLEQRNELLARFEREYILGALDRNEGKISRAAISAGLDRTHFKRLLARSRR